MALDSLQVSDLFQKVCQLTNYKSGSFELTIQKVKLEEDDQTTIEKQTWANQNKIIINLIRKTDSKDIDFPNEKEESEDSNIHQAIFKEKLDEDKLSLAELEKWETLDDKRKSFITNKLSKYLTEEFEEKKKSFLELKLPGTENRFTDALIRQFATESTLKLYEVVLKTIPHNPKDPNLSITDFCYKFNEDGILVNTETGNRFHWVNQVHYDLLGDLIIPYIQEQMVKQFGMVEVKLPEKSDLPPHIRSNIFVTADLETNKNKLMLLIQGSGAVRAGQWARALCINDTIKSGSILPYLEKAIKLGYAVIVFNPNLNRVTKDPLSRPKREDFFIPGKPRLPEVPTVKIPHNESPPEHCIYVWDTYGVKSPANQVVIVAHSAGGSCTMSLLRERGKDILPKLKAIAFTDSVHWVSPKDPSSVVKFLKKNAINWVQSDKPLDTPESNKDSGCVCLSSGHTKHEHTSYSAIESVFKYLIDKTS